jgi:prolipoprotein diacylglyceryltransferase
LGDYLPEWWLLLHPSQLYEMALEGVILFFILNWFIKKPRPLGSVSGLFFKRYVKLRLKRTNCSFKACYLSVLLCVKAKLLFFEIVCFKAKYTYEEGS